MKYFMLIVRETDVFRGWAIRFFFGGGVACSQTLLFSYAKRRKTTTSASRLGGGGEGVGRKKYLADSETKKKKSYRENLKKIISYMVCVVLVIKIFANLSFCPLNCIHTSPQFQFDCTSFGDNRILKNIISILKVLKECVANLYI